MKRNLTVEVLQENIAREIEIIPEYGVTDGYGKWTSKEDEETRLSNLQGEIIYFMREYC